jgi:hypothetical protein
METTNINPLYGSDPQELGCFKQFGQGVADFFGDEQWMAMTTGLISMSSNSCSLMEQDQAGEFIPYLGMVSGPLYLYHSVKSTAEKFKLTASAVKTGRVADTLFWTGGAVGSFGIALSNAIKPVAGSVVLFGLSHIVALHTIFSFVVPIVLISFSSIGAIHQAWSLGRTELSRCEFERRRFHLKNFNDLTGFLTYLQGPPKPVGVDEDSLETHEYKLDHVRFESTHSTGSSRREAIQERIQVYMRKQEEAQKTLQLILELMQKTQTQSIDETLELTEQTITLAQQQGHDVSKLVQGKEELLQLKQLCDEGNGILHTVESEIDRKIANQNLTILSILLTLGAGLILLFAPESEHYLGYALSISSTALGIFSVVFDKCVSQEDFLKLEQFFGTLHSSLAINPA